MFEQTFVKPNAAGRKSQAVLVSFLGQVLLLAILVLSPLVFLDTISAAKLNPLFLAPVPPPAPPPLPSVPQSPPNKRPTKTFCVLCVPKKIPTEIVIFKDKEEPLPPPTLACKDCVVGGGPNTPEGPFVPGFTPPAGPPPTPPVVKEPTKPETPQKPVRLSTGVADGHLVSKILPQYPPMAKQAGIQGVVRFNAIIGKDGKIRELQFVSGHPMLVEAARLAISQWVYKPWKVSGELVEVSAQIDVNFSLSR